MRLFLLIFIISMFSCSDQDKSSESSVNEQQKAELDQPDSIIIDGTSSENTEQTVKDSIIYIGFVDDFYFSESNEIYTQLYFKRPISTWEEYDSISKLTEKVIYQDDENSRNLISTKTAEANFDLRGLDRVWLFDTSNMQIGIGCELKNFEFLNQNISSVFIAVYETPIKTKIASYCIGGLKPKFDNLSIKSVLDTNTIVEIEQYFKQSGVATTYTLDHSQYSLSDSLVLTISNTNDFSFIHKSLRGMTTRIYDNNDFENIVDIQLVPILKNEMPILLCHFLTPESDFDWTEVLVYNGDRYEKAENQRVKINNR